jgi:hypothetical protein
MAWRKNFFAMARGEKIALSVLILFAAASFLPITRSVEVAGMALFGWLMAAGGLFGPPETREMRERIAALHVDEPSR